MRSGVPGPPCTAWGREGVSTKDTKGHEGFRPVHPRLQIKTAQARKPVPPATKEEADAAPGRAHRSQFLDMAM